MIIEIKETKIENLAELEKVFPPYQVNTVEKLVSKLHFTDGLYTIHSLLKFVVEGTNYTKVEEEYSILSSIESENGDMVRAYILSENGFDRCPYCLSPDVEYASAREVRDDEFICGKCEESFTIINEAVRVSFDNYKTEHDI